MKPRKCKYHEAFQTPTVNARLKPRQSDSRSNYTEMASGVMLP